MGAMKRSPLVLVMLAACGGDVVVGVSSNQNAGAAAQGSGGQTQTTSTGTGMGGTVLMTGATSSTGLASACQSTTCTTDPSGACACIGTCSNGDEPADCPGGGAQCSCSLEGPTLSMIGSCTPGPEAKGNPCDFVTGCCAQFF